MSKTLTLEIPDEVFSTYQKMAENKGETAEKIVLEFVINNVPHSNKVSDNDAREAEKRFARHFGAINSGDARSADNDKIDADLIRAYANAQDDD